MLKLALTGGIATGKSYVLARFASRGVPAIDADVIAREVVQRGTPGWRTVREHFGDSVLQRDGEIDRAKLGQVVFRDAKARRALESIIHPAVYDAIAGWMGRLPLDTRFALADIPLLYETGHEHEFDSVIVTWCSRETQLERMMARDRLSLDDARRRLAAQLSTNEKARRANYIVRTEGSYAETDAQVEKIYAELVSAAREPGL